MNHHLKINTLKTLCCKNHLNALHWKCWITIFTIEEPKGIDVLQDLGANKNEDSLAGGRWAWPRFQHMPQPIGAHVRVKNPLDDNGPEDEEEEEDPAHPRRR
jgi:hypothetical protein